MVKANFKKGVFEMYRYFDYAIKCVIRKIINLLFKPKIFLILAISFIAFWFFSNNYETKAVYTGDDTYTDRNQTIFSAYGVIINDMISRLENSGNTEIKDFLNDKYSFYCFYGDLNGSTMLNSSTFATSKLYVALYPKDTQTSSYSGVADTYQGMQCNIRTIKNVFLIYEFNNNTLTNLYSGSNIYVPVVLINYRNSDINSYLLDNSTSSITSSIDKQTNTIEQQTATIQEQTNTVNDTNNFIKDETVEENSMNVDISDFDVSDSEKNVDNFFTTFLSTIYNSFFSMSDEVISLDIELPFVKNGVISVKSNMIYEHIKNSWIYTTIQLFWTVVFGTYIVRFIYRIFSWLSSGKIATSGGISDFIWMLDTENTIIKSFMM